MSHFRTSFVAAGFAVLAACATSSGGGSAIGGSSGALRVCSGGGVSNAPATDRRGRVINYQPLTTIRGVTVARAPVRACVSSGFGPRRGGAGRFHKGIDLYTRSPTPVYAGADGTVEVASSVRGYGKLIVIRHGGRVKTRYAHLSSYARGIRPGQRVRRGQQIGRTGETGNATAVHLHYEILVNGRAQNPLTVGQ